MCLLIILFSYNLINWALITLMPSYNLSVTDPIGECLLNNPNDDLTYNLNVVRLYNLIAGCRPYTLIALLIISLLGLYNHNTPL